MPHHRETWLRRALGVIAIAGLVGAVVMLVVGWATGSVGGRVLQLLLTFTAAGIGAWLMHVQLHSRDRYAPGSRASMLLSAGVAMVLVSQFCFLLLVWSDQWKSWTVVWRTWWLSMVPSVFITHLIVLRAVAVRRRGIIERLTGACSAWAGAMVFWLGLRADMLADIPPVFLWIGAVPAGGAVAGTLYVAVRRLVGRTPTAALSRRAVVTLVLVTNFLVALVGFYVGRSTADHAGPAGSPEDVAREIHNDLGRQFVSDQYLAQQRVATWLGDTRFVDRPPFVSVEQIGAIAPRLRPGDIILERRNWYLSNSFLPGFWPHAALYVGSVDDLRRLGILDRPEVRAKLADFQAADPDGHPHAIIEAMSEGVVFTSLEHSLHADYIAVLRPRLSEAQVAEAIARAFSHVGKPYDFNFDFDDRSKLVCTQLVCVSYEGLLDFPTVTVMGRRTLPANEIARRFVAELSSDAGRQLDLVLFLDGDGITGTAREADEAAFCQSVTRPRALVER